MQATTEIPNPKRIDIWQEQCSYWDNTFSLLLHTTLQHISYQGWGAKWK